MAFHPPEAISSDEKAGFNMAIETLRRINKILMDIEYYRRNKVYAPWFEGLQSLYIELDSFLNEKEREELNILFKNIGPFIRSLQNDGTTIRKPVLENSLILIELEQRRKLQKYDLLMPKKGDISSAMLN